MKQGQRFLQKSGLARSRAGNETDGQHSRFAETLTKRTSHYIVLFENILSDFYKTRFAWSFFDLQRYDFQFFAPNDIGSRCETLRTTKPLDRANPPLHLALGTKYFDWNFLNQ